MAKQKGFRLDDETERKFKELVKIYNSKSENHCFELMINELYELKKSKALVPYEELDKRDRELKIAFLKVGELQGTLQEKDKRIEELQNSKKGFWAKLFGL